MHIDFVSLKIGKTIGILISKIMTLCSLANSPDDSNHIVPSQQTSHPTCPSIDIFCPQLRVCYIPFFYKKQRFYLEGLAHYVK